MCLMLRTVINANVQIKITYFQLTSVVRTGAENILTKLNLLKYNIQWEQFVFEIIVDTFAIE